MPNSKKNIAKKRSERVDYGKTTEHHFAAKCLRRGIGVAWPTLEAIPYDVILDNGKDLFRVQIKSTYVKSKAARSDKYSVTVHKGSGAYTNQEIDFLVAYVYETDDFYIIPIHLLGTQRNIYLYPHRRGVGNFEHFRNAWELLL